MGARTDAARAEVLARRGEFVGETERLEASARAAADIPAKIRRNPVKTIGAAGGAAFFLLGGPQRLYKRARRAVLGPKADLPKSMLPKEVDRVLRQMGDNGDKVRVQVEREFAKWLRERAKVGTESDAKAAAVAMLALALKPVASQIGKQLARQLADPDPASFNAALEKVRRRNASVGEPAGPEMAPAREMAPTDR